MHLSPDPRTCAREACAFSWRAAYTAYAHPVYLRRVCMAVGGGGEGGVAENE